MSDFTINYEQPETEGTDRSMFAKISLPHVTQKKTVNITGKIQCGYCKSQIPFNHKFTIEEKDGSDMKHDFNKRIKQIYLCQSCGLKIGLGINGNNSGISYELNVWSYPETVKRGEKLDRVILKVDNVEENHSVNGLKSNNDPKLIIELYKKALRFQKSDFPPLIRHELTYKYLLLVKKDSNFESFQDKQLVINLISLLEKEHNATLEEHILKSLDLNNFAKFEAYVKEGFGINLNLPLGSYSSQEIISQKEKYYDKIIDKIISSFTDISEDIYNLPNKNAFLKILEWLNNQSSKSNKFSKVNLQEFQNNEIDDIKGITQQGKETYNWKDNLPIEYKENGVFAMFSDGSISFIGDNNFHEVNSIEKDFVLKGNNISLIIGFLFTSLELIEKDETLLNHLVMARAEIQSWMQAIELTKGLEKYKLINITGMISLDILIYRLVVLGKLDNQTLDVIKDISDLSSYYQYLTRYYSGYVEALEEYIKSEHVERITNFDLFLTHLSAKKSENR